MNLSICSDQFINMNGDSIKLCGMVVPRIKLRVSNRRKDLNLALHCIFVLHFSLYPDIQTSLEELVSKKLHIRDQRATQIFSFALASRGFYSSRLRQHCKTSNGSTLDAFCSSFRFKGRCSYDLPRFL